MKRVAVLLAFIVVAGLAAVVPPGAPIEAQNDCFGNGFCITSPSFARYFRERGGRNIFGDAISSEFTLEGFRVQFFQRVILQQQGDLVQRINVLDGNIMPMTRVNQSQFPPNDPCAPVAGAPESGGAELRDRRHLVHSARVAQYVQRHPVGFFDLFNTTVPVEIAFPAGNPGPGLVTLRTWRSGACRPRSRPPIPATAASSTSATSAASCITKPGAGDSTASSSASTSRRSSPPSACRRTSTRTCRAAVSITSTAPARRAGWPALAELPNTDLTNAFEPGIGSVTPPPPPPAPPPQPAATATATAVPVGGCLHHRAA